MLSDNSTGDRNRANHTGTQLSTTISDFTEAAQDAAGALITAGTKTGITATYNDANNRIDLAVTLAPQLTTARTIGTLTGDVTSAGSTFNGTANNTNATTIANNAVTLAKMADVSTGTVFYRKSASTGDPEVQTLATLKTDLGLTGTNSGDQTITLTGDVTGSGTGSFATTIASNAVTNAKMADMGANTIKGAISAGDPVDLTQAEVKTMLALPTNTISDLAGKANLTGGNSFTGSQNIKSTSAPSSGTTVLSVSASTDTALRTMFQSDGSIAFGTGVSGEWNLRAQLSRHSTDNLKIG
jgi:hypothetical protein